MTFYDGAGAQKTGGREWTRINTNLRGDFVVRFDGSPGVTYTIECAENVSPANWQKAANMTAPGTDQGLGAGVFEFCDSSTAAPHRFYRAVWPSY